MLNLTISFDDPTERLLYGAPDPYLALFECRHEVDWQHHHNEVNPPTGPTGPEPPEPPDTVRHVHAIDANPRPGPRPDFVRADAGTDSRVAEPA